MRIAKGSIFRWLVIPYSPCPDAQGVLDAAVSQRRDDLEVGVAVLDGAASRKFFGVPMARRGIQPVWVHVVNRSTRPYRLQFVALDPNHFSPLEAAALNHYSGGKRLLGFGLLAWLFLPLLVLLPIKLWAVRRANMKMDALFLEQAFRMRPISPGGEQAGFVFTNLSEGNKIVLVRLLGPDGLQDFEFSLQVEGLRTDTCDGEFDALHAAEEATEVDLPGLRQYVAAAPQATTNSRGGRSGDPVNLVVVGDFPTVLGELGARWERPKSSAWRRAGSIAPSSQVIWRASRRALLLGHGHELTCKRIHQLINGN